MGQSVGSRPQGGLGTWALGHPELVLDLCVQAAMWHPSDCQEPRVLMGQSLGRGPGCSPWMVTS